MFFCVVSPPPLYHIGLPCSLLPPMYMSSFLTSSPVTWSKVRPSDETTAYLAPSYRLTSKLTPSYSKRRHIRSCTHTQHTHTRTHTLIVVFPPVDIRAEEILNPPMWFASCTLMLTICSQSTNALKWQAPYTWRAPVRANVCSACEECEADAGGQMRATPNIFTVIWFNSFLCSAVVQSAYRE